MESEGGYRGTLFKFLRQAKASVGDVVRVRCDQAIYEGVLMPRSELGDEAHLVIKLRSGYNIGVRARDNMEVTVVGRGSAPAYTSSRPQGRDRNLPKVTIISTGGTIASRVDYRTGAVTPGLTAEDLYSSVPELSQVAQVGSKPLYTMLSENFEPRNWAAIAVEVANQFMEGSSGIVVTQGTDTLGYTAAALSFALQNLPAPVILVGAQRSSDRPSSDTAVNLLGAVDVAARGTFAEVAVVMHEGFSDEDLAIHRGTRVRKCHTSSRDAFQSINSPPLGSYNVPKRRITVDVEVRERDSRRILQAKPNFEENVALVKFHPGLDSKVIEFLLDYGVKGIVLEGTGLGHIGQKWFDHIEKARKERIPVGMTSQCIWGRIDMNVYDGGRYLLKRGVIPLEDMIPETALVKMMWCLGQTQTYDEVRKMMVTNVAGELSSRSLPRIMK